MRNDVTKWLLERLRGALRERRRRAKVREILLEAEGLTTPHPDMDLTGFWEFDTKVSSVVWGT
jgi:hypothetical protein